METAVTSTKFVQYILGKVDNSPQAWQRAYESLRLHPTQLSLLTTDAGGTEHQRFIHRFDTYAERLIYFLNRMPQNLGRSSEAIEKQKSIGAIITGNLLSDLLSPSFSQLWNRDSLFELTISTLQFAHSEHLRQIADLLRKCPALLGKIVSSERSSQLLRPWIRLICSQRPNIVTLELWTEVIANSCAACPDNHGLKATLQQWEKVQLVRKSLKGADSVLKLDGSLRTTDISQAVSLEVCKAIKELMPASPIHKPITISTLQHFEFETTASILSKLCNSMPCRRCFARFRDPTYIATQSGAHPAPQRNTILAAELYGLDLEDVLFGQSLGPWKIVLSAQALRDLQNSKPQGNFNLVWAKLKDLSTGDWVRRSVAKPLTLGSVDLKVRLFVASYCTNGGILWQVDTAYDLRVCSQSQVVKVWRIGDSDDVTHAAEIVAQIQRHWSEARVNRCKVNKLDRAKGLKVAATFPDLDDKALPAEPEIDPPEVASEATVNLLISNKFHSLTNRIFDNIISGNQYAEFAFLLDEDVVDIVKHFKTAVFILGRSGTGKTTCLLYKLLSRYLASHMVAAEDNDCLRQILVTRSKQLANKLHVELNALVNAQLLDHTQNKPRSAENTEGNWDGASEETNESLFTLKQNQFPLVCTFAHFLRLIENTIRENDKQNFAISEQKNVSEFVDFNFFQKVYWPQLLYQNASEYHLEAGIVFSEIMGVIKGAASMRNGLKPLSREEYLTRSPNLAPAFPTPVMREMIFNLYSQYERRRKQRGDEDAMDQMINILHGVRRYGLEERLRNIIQEIYVDEVQDQRPIEIELFLDLVENPLGIHCAGDSAQCISNDSAFRFANVKALFFDRYSNTKYELAKPILRSLSRNYRSHQGILKFASFVMSLLWKGFPTMVDNLGPEISMAWGDKPVIFVGACVTDLLGKVSGLAHVGSDDHAGSVASNKQVVIVRDDITRSQLESILAKKRMVYTILESKGMEYDDVFLYNFFQSSPCSAAMRTLEALLPNQVNDGYAESNLKLYVAITRPRHRLWILETSPSSILELLTKLPKPLVDIKYIDHDHLSEIASTLRPTAETTTEDWIQTGHQCMENGLYDRAIHCFEMAGDSGDKLKNWANACYYEQAGREQRANEDLHSFRKSFKEAASLFQVLGMLEKASGCFEASEYYAEAAEMWSTNKQHERAADLFEKAGILFIEKAAEEYYAACLPGKALSFLYKKRHFESVIEGLTIHMNDDQIDNATRKIYATGCNRYVRQTDTKPRKGLRDKAFNLFINVTEKKEFLECFGYYEELVKFCHSIGEFQPAVWGLILAGKLEAVLALSQSDEEWPWPPNISNFFGQLYQTIEAQKLIQALYGKISLKTVFSAGEMYATAPWAKHWEDQIGICRDIFLRKWFPRKEGLHKGATDLMSILILLKPDHITKIATRLSHFTCILEYLEDYMQFLKGQAPTFPESTKPCLGLLSSPWDPEGTYYCTPWSVMREVQAIVPADKEIGSHILTEAHRYLGTTLLPSVVDEILTRASESPVLRVPTYTCHNCVSKGNWSPCNGLAHCHPLPAKSVCLQQFKDRVKWWCVRVQIMKTSSTYKLLSPNSILMKGNDLEKQLRYFFSYQSAFLQDAAVMHEARWRILQHNRYKPLLEHIQVVCHHVVSTEITGMLQVMQKERSVSWDQDNLSNLINGYHLMWQFANFSYLETALLKLEQPPPYCLEPFRHYHRLRLLRLRDMHFPNIVRIIGDLQHGLDEFIATKCSSYDADIIAIFEHVATLLLFLGWHLQVLIPNSWSEQHLPHCMRVLRPTVPLERAAYRYLLYRLATSFCNMIIHIELIRELLARRSVDFLVVILVNFGNPSPTQSFYWALCRGIKAVLRIPALHTSTICLMPAHKYMTALLQAFEVYNQKDHLCLYICETGPIGRAAGTEARNISKTGLFVHARPGCKARHRGCNFKPKADEERPVLLRQVARILCQGYEKVKKRRQAAAMLIYQRYQKVKERRAQIREIACVLCQRYQKVKKRRAQIKEIACVLCQRYEKVKERRRQAAIMLIHRRYQIVKKRRAQIKEIAGVLCQRYQKVKERQEQLRAESRALCQRYENGNERQRQAAIMQMFQRYRKIKEIRSHLASPDGTAMAVRSIKTLFRKKRLQEKTYPLTQYLQLLSVMLTEGVPLYLELERVFDEFLELDRKATATGFKMKYGKRMDQLYDEIDAPWNALFQEENFVVFDLNEKSLRERLAEGMEMITRVRHKIEKLTSEIFAMTSKDSTESSAVRRQEVQGHTPEMSAVPSKDLTQSTPNILSPGFTAQTAKITQAIMNWIFQG
ncbi:hypothetical protein BDZ91DRAFT_741800 [Kalaharituber pfeilii]|nr:hypothetical protein BDZ91DRAFT_741800 [Kalaharituber pfeilii]